MSAFGIDISKWQGDWKLPKVFTPQFVLARATWGSRGPNAKDPRFHECREMCPARVRFGAWHVILASTPCHDQFHHFVDYAEPKIGEAVGLDLETKHAKELVAKFGHAGAKGFIFSWLSAARAKLRCEPLWYVSTRGIRVLTDNYREPLDGLENFRLWLCLYSEKLVLPRTHTDHFMHQYSSKGTGKAYGFSSTYVDLNRMNGPIERWDEVAIRPRIEAFP